MKTFFRSMCVATIVTTSFVSSHSLVSAQDKKPTAPKEGGFVPAEEILDKQVELTGGKKAESLKSRTVEAVFALPAQGLKADMRIVQAAPGKLYIKIDIPGIGLIEQGTDGKEAWEKSVLAGMRVLEGDEKEAFLLRADLTAELNWRKYFKSVETTGSKMVGDTDCWVVTLTSEGSEKPTTNYYDKKTGMLRKSTMSSPSPQGELEVDSEFSDYKEVDGFRMAFTTTVTVLGQQQVITVKKVTHDGEVDAKVFETPTK